MWMGFPTQAGSRLPSELFQGQGSEECLQAAGWRSVVFRKTVTTEFAYFSPGPTRNPHNPEHTPGGSSSGSAAAVAAGFATLRWERRPSARLSALRPFAAWLG